ncbi:hypothetical protein ACLMJK_005889 [Lecanora helva]
MSALVGYGSSDEEEEEEVSEGKQSFQGAGPIWYPTSMLIISAPVNGVPADPVQASGHEHSPFVPLVGPFGPPQSVYSSRSPELAPSSPYTAKRTTIHNLTLPINPNFEIPPSPSASPTDTDRKFSQFIDLKKQGVHFNAKLASSSALKNPSLLPKLMKSAGIQEPQQYNTTLPSSLWDPLHLPGWAYTEELNESQQALAKQKEEERLKNQRTGIEFISAGNSGLSSRGGTPGLSAKGTKGSAAERVMAGLDRERKP